MVKGYTQMYGGDIFGTFSPVAGLNFVCILILVATHFDWILLQLDVKNVFLHCKVYIE